MRLKNRILLSVCTVFVTVSFLHPFSGKISYAEGASAEIAEAEGENPETEETGAEEAGTEKIQAEASETETDAEKEETEDVEMDGASAAGEEAKDREAEEEAEESETEEAAESEMQVLEVETEAGKAEEASTAEIKASEAGTEDGEEEAEAASETEETETEADTEEGDREAETSETAAEAEEEAGEVGKITASFYLQDADGGFDRLDYVISETPGKGKSAVTFEIADFPSKKDLEEELEGLFEEAHKVYGGDVGRDNLVGAPYEFTFSLDDFTLSYKMDGDEITDDIEAEENCSVYIYVDWSQPEIDRSGHKVTIMTLDTGAIPEGEEEEYDTIYGNEYYLTDAELETGEDGTVDFTADDLQTEVYGREFLFFEIEGYEDEIFLEDTLDGIIFNEDAVVYARYTIMLSPGAYYSSFSAPTLYYEATSLGISSSAPKAGQVNTYGASGNDGVSATWTVPASGYYNITCHGSSGGYGSCSGTKVKYGDAGHWYAPENGKIYGAKIYLTKGYTLTVHCGGTLAQLGNYEDKTVGWDDGQTGDTSYHYCDSEDDHNTRCRGGAGGGSSYVSYNGTKLVSAAGGTGGDTMCDYEETIYSYGASGGGTTGSAGVTGVASVSSVIATGTEDSFHTGYITVEVVSVNPSCSITASTSSYTNGNVTLTANISSAGAGLASSPYSWNGGSYGTSKTCSAAKNGTYTLSVKDTSGNTGSATYKVSCIDKLAPSAELSASTTAWTNGNVALAVSAEDAAATSSYAKSGLAGTAYSWDGGETWTAAKTKTVSENGAYSCVVRDAVGNTKTVSLQVSNIDKTAPSMSFEEDTAWYAGEGRDISYGGEDDGSGLADTPYSWDGGESWTAERVRHVTVNGTYYFMVRDAAGNTASYTYAVDNIDGTAPEASLEADTEEWVGAETGVVLTVTARDSEATESYGQSGLADMAYMWGEAADGEFQAVTGEWSDKPCLHVYRNGEYAVRVCDLAGNETELCIAVGNIDGLAPEISLEADTEEWVGAATGVVLTVTARDSEATESYGQSGLMDTAYSWETDKEGNNIWTDVAVYKASQNGTYICRVRDNAGNETEASIQVANISFREENTEDIVETEQVEVAEETAQKSNRKSGDYKIAVPILNIWAEEAGPEKEEEAMEIQNTAVTSMPDQTQQKTTLSFFSQPEEAEEVIEKKDDRQNAVSLSADTGETEPEGTEENVERVPDRMKAFWKKVILYSVWMAVLLCGLLWLLSCLIFEHVTVYRREKGEKYHKAGRCAIVRKKEYKQINLLRLMQRGENKDYKIRFSSIFALLHKNDKVLLRTYHGVELRNVEKEIEILSCNS